MRTKPNLRKLRLVACLFIGFLTSTLTLSAATVRGRVINRDNYPTGGIGVRVFHYTLGYSNFAVSGRDGMYYLFNIPPGGYRLEFWFGNRLIRTVNIGVNEPMTDIPPVQI